MTAYGIFKPTEIPENFCMWLQEISSWYSFPVLPLSWTCLGLIDIIFVEESANPTYPQKMFSRKSDRDYGRPSVFTNHVYYAISVLSFSIRGNAFILQFDV